MAANNHQKRRLEELLKLAQTYRGCNRKQLAQALGRDASNLVPDSGIPKVDLVVELARVLDWPLEDVVKALWSDGEVAAPRPVEAVATFEALDAEAVQAHIEGRYTDMVEVAREAYAAADNGEHRAKACNREAGGWDGLGRYRNALEALQRGLRQTGVTLDRKMLLRANLANAYYTMWQLVEGTGVAGDVIGWLEHTPPKTLTARVASATARYVRGNCYRRMMEVEPERVEELATRARADLVEADALFTKLGKERDAYAGIANTCRGGVIELDVALGRIGVDDGLQLYADALDQFVDPGDWPVGDWLESYGWWCIFGCNVALRHLDDERELQQRMAIFTNKADEIADRLGNWSMRERVFTLEYARRQRFNDWTGVETDWTIDKEDVRVIAGTMGRFPAFQETGWQILRTAKFIRDN